MNCQNKFQACLGFKKLSFYKASIGARAPNGSTRLGRYIITITARMKNLNNGIILNTGLFKIWKQNDFYGQVSRWWSEYFSSIFLFRACLECQTFQKLWRFETKPFKIQKHLKSVFLKVGFQMVPFSNGWTLAMTIDGYSQSI